MDLEWLPVLILLFIVLALGGGGRICGLTGDPTTILRIRPKKRDA